MKKLKGLKLEDYQHESDKAAFLSLEKVKAFDKAVDWVIKNTIEEVTNVQQTGSSICVNQDATPELFNLVNDVTATVDVSNVPQVYTRWGYDIYITTDGDKHPKMIVNTGTVDLLTPAEQRFMIGHEFGHIKSNHLKYLLLCRYWSLYHSSLYDNLNIEAFIEQAESFNISKMGVMNKIVEKISVMDNAAPWMVRRASELLKWYKSGAYQNILSKYAK